MTDRKNPIKKKSTNNTSLPPKESITLIQASQTFAGPLPPPEILKQYEQITPGAADRIIKMAEEQSSHRRTLEAKVVSSNIQNEKRGSIFAFTISIIIIISGFILILFNKDVAGLIALIGTPAFHGLSFLLQKYILGKKELKKDQD